MAHSGRYCQQKSFNIYKEVKMLNIDDLKSSIILSHLNDTMLKKILGVTLQSIALGITSSKKATMPNIFILSLMERSGLNLRKLTIS